MVRIQSSHIWSYAQCEKNKPIAHASPKKKKRIKKQNFVGNENPTENVDNDTKLHRQSPGKYLKLKHTQNTIFLFEFCLHRIFIKILISFISPIDNNYNY